MHPSGEGLDADALACLNKRNAAGATPAQGMMVEHPPAAHVAVGSSGAASAATVGLSSL
jgi:hypothetical protein